MAGFDADFFNSLPKMAPPPAEPSYGQNPLVSGFISGGIGLGADLAAMGGAVGRATGITPLAEGGEALAKHLSEKSRAAGLPQYEENPWSVSGMGYQVAKAVPMMASLLVGGEALAPAKVAGWASEAGRLAPRVLGGAGGAVGEVAEKAGSDWARHLIGGGLAGYPVMAGGAYNQQLENNGPDRGKAALSLLAGAPEAAIGAVMPAQLRALADKGLAGSLARRVLTGGAAAGAAGMVQGGLQAALNQPFEAEGTPFSERAKHIVQSALLQGAVGGLFGVGGSALGGNKPHAMDTPPAPEPEMYGPNPRPPSEPAPPYTFNQSPEAAPNTFFDRTGQGQMFGSPAEAVAQSVHPADPSGQLDLFQNGPHPTPENAPVVPRQLEYQPADGQRVLPGMTPPEPQFPMPPEGPAQGPHDMGPQFPGFDAPGEAPAPLPDLSKALPLTDGRPPIPGHEPTVGSVPHALDTMNKLITSLDDIRGAVQKKFEDASNDPVTWGQKLRTFGLGWADADEMVLRADKILGGNAAKWMDARKYGRVVTDRLGQMALPVRAAAVEVAKTNPQANKVWDSLRSANQIHGFDYRKWSDEQPDVFAGMAPEKEQALRRVVDDAKRQWDSIAPVAGKADDMMRLSGQIANNVKMTLTLDAIYRRLYSDRNLPSFALDPIMELTQHPDMLADLPKAVAFTRDALANRLKEMETLGAANAPDVVAMRERAKAIDSQIAEMTGSKTLEAINAAQATLSGLKGRDPAMSRSLREHIDQLKASIPEPDEKTLEAIKAAKEQSAKTHQEVQTLTDYQTGLAKTVGSYKSAMEYADKTPFFHLGRDGDHFASMRLKTDQTGALDPAAADRLGQLLQAKGMDNIVIDQMNENNHFFTRVDSRTQRKTLEDIAAVLQKEGWLAPDKVDPETKVTTEHAFSSGEVGQMDAKQFGGVAPAAVERLLSQIAADHASLPPEVAEKLMGHMRSIYLDMLPKNSMVRLFEPRQGVMGHRSDMTANFDQYQTQFANAAGRMWSQPRVLDALSGMANAVDGYKHDLNSGAMKDVASAYAKEIMTRETGNTPRSGLKWQRDVLAANHAYFLTLSPAYTTELLLQVPMLLLPQLGRKYGYLQSASATAGATNNAFKVVKALINSGHGSDAFLTPDALIKAGMSPGDADFAMQIANRGGFELGSWTHAVTGDAPMLARSNVMQALNTFTVASEVFPRALAAFAAKSLHESDGGKKSRMGLHDYVDETLAGSNYNWQTDLQARHLGAGGFAGPITPLVTKFMSYQTKSLHRLYREADTAFGSMADERASSPEEAKALKEEARRYLAGHLSAVTMLAGSLGLPVLPVAASAASSLANFFTGTDDYDAEGWYRSHLKDAFGPVAAEAIAKGVPRLMGMDLSEHAGEERLLPFSDMLTDKRKWSDVFSSAAFHALGSPFSMGANFIKGGTDIYNGQLLNGLQEALPSAAKNMVRAFRMGTGGYESNNGVKLPLGDPSAADIAMQVVGITPAAKAAYDETTEALRNLQDRRQIVTHNLSANMVEAFNRGDAEGLQHARANTMDFVRGHPWMANEIVAPINHAVQTQAMGQAFGANNINPRDQDQRRILRSYGMP